MNLRERGKSCHKSCCWNSVSATCRITLSRQLKYHISWESSVLAGLVRSLIFGQDLGIRNSSGIAVVRVFGPTQRHFPHLRIPYEWTPFYMKNNLDFIMLFIIFLCPFIRLHSYIFFTRVRFYSPDFCLVAYTVKYKPILDLDYTNFSVSSTSLLSPCITVKPNNNHAKFPITWEIWSVVLLPRLTLCSCEWTGGFIAVIISSILLFYHRK